MCEQYCSSLRARQVTKWLSRKERDVGPEVGEAVRNVVEVNWILLVQMVHDVGSSTNGLLYCSV